MSLAAGENYCTAFRFKAMFEAGAVTCAQPSVTKVGGFTEMLKVIALAEACGISLLPHCPCFGPGLLASLHLLGTMGDEVHAERRHSANGSRSCARSVTD
jgi:L-alanine-DL-glutamate epimerase-like enolase superfamily enzyme